jgi:hypothetical protein
VPEINKNNILRAIKTGNSYAMTIGKDLMQSEREGYNDSMPMLKNFAITTDTLHVKFSLPAKDIIISGENGRLLYKVSDNDSVSFKLGKQEPYARVTAVYNKGTQLLLNPVFRYKTSPLYQSTASINSTQTSLLRTAGVIALLVWFGLILKLPLPQKAQKKLLPNISTNSYGYISNIHSKIIKVGIAGSSGICVNFFITWMMKEKLKSSKYVANTTAFSCSSKQFFSELYMDI